MILENRLKRKRKSCFRSNNKDGYQDIKILWSIR